MSNDDWDDHQRWDRNRIYVGWNLVEWTCNSTYVAFIKYDLPILEDFQNIMDIKLIFPNVYYKLEDEPFQLNISLVSNSWNETDSSDILWENQPKYLGKSIIHTFKNVYGELYGQSLSFNNKKKRFKVIFNLFLNPNLLQISNFL